MVRKRLWPPSSSFCSDCRSWLTRPIGTKAENDFTPASRVSMARERTAIPRIDEVTDLGDFEGKLLERRGDHASEEEDDDDLQHHRDQPEDGEADVVGLEGAGEVCEGRDDEKLPLLAEVRRQGRQAGKVVLAAMGESERAFAAARAGAEGDGRQLVVER